ncbi:MAG: hypothetical protein KDD44_09695, partial [Bdellovibrionales bacterium]|nr:hypothetical protein [Bdellovibrionales bacterium]
RVVGTHSGVHRFTVGQRRGLGLSAPNPLYVLNIDAESATVTVGERAALEREGFRIRKPHWVSGNEPAVGSVFRAKLRYRHGGVPVIYLGMSEDASEAVFRFDGEWSAVSPGQAAVLYCTEDQRDGAVEVMGGGIIAAAW